MQWFRPILAGATLGARLIACLGALVGIAATAVLSAGLTGSIDPLLIAPIGASAVLVFAVPASPLAQPWPVIGGNILSALLGVAVAQTVPDVAIAAALAVSGAILLMSLTRCLHPPGGAAALTAVIGGEGVRALGYGFVLAPIAINSVLLVAAALIFHRLARGNYPHRPATVARPRREISDDLDRALAQMGDSFDIAPEDLEALFERAAQHARERRRAARHDRRETARP